MIDPNYEKIVNQGKASVADEREHETALFARRVTEIPNNLKFRADYDGRTDGQPVYLGYAARGVSESTSGWILYKMTYDASNQVTERDIAYDSWAKHTTASYD